MWATMLWANYPRCAAVSAAHPSKRASDDGDDEKWTVEKQRDEAGAGEGA